MPWPRKRLGITRYKFNKDGSPHEDYWVAGFYYNTIEDLGELVPKVYEIRPIQGRTSKILTSISQRSIELWKEPDTKEIRIIATALSQDKSFPGEMGHDYNEIDQIRPNWVTDDEQFGFDIELTLQYNFADLTDSPNILNMISSMISQYEKAGIWVQVSFENMTDRLVRIASRTYKKLSESKIPQAHDMDAQYSKKCQGSLIAVSIRGLVSKEYIMDIASALDGILSTVTIPGDGLRTYTYDYGMIPWLETRRVCSEGAIQRLEQNEQMWKDPGWGKSCDAVPFFVHTPVEFGKMIRMPDDPALRITYMRPRTGGAVHTRTGFALDGQEFGKMSVSAAALDPSGLLSHTYVLGATGCGKSSLLRSTLKHLEMANLQGTYSSAQIVIDIKDEDAILCARQCDDRTIPHMTYIDVNGKSFALNLLELPQHDPKDREAVISRTVGYVVSILKEAYSQPQTYIQVERVLRLLLLYMYENTTVPTMVDLYEIITSVQKNSEQSIKHIRKVYSKISVKEMDTALNALAKLHRDAWTPLINRIEPFVIESYTRTKFSAKQSSIDFDAMLEPGNITIFRIAEAQTPAHIHGMAAKIIAMRVWAAVLARYERKTKTTPVILFLDEFHTICDMTTLHIMLSRGRSLGLGLVLAHQNISQIPSSLFEGIVGNTSSQFYGRVSGADASLAARVIDPANAKILSSQLSAQPSYTFAYSAIPEVGKERSSPGTIQSAPPPGIIQDVSILESEPVADTSKENSILAKHDHLKQVLELPPTKMEWDIIRTLRKGPLKSGEITIEIKYGERNDVAHVIKELANRNIIEKLEPVPEGTGRPSSKYELTDKTRKKFFPKSWAAIGIAKDIDLIASAAFEHYVSKGMFACIALQGANKNELRTDLFAYDYEREAAISVEIESYIEARTHPEHVIFNMTKWRDMGFVECHVWSTSKKILDLHKRVPKHLAERVTCHIIDDVS